MPPLRPAPPRYFSRYFSRHEATRSNNADEAGLANEPGPAEWAALENLFRNTMDPIRHFLGRPIRPSSAYRSPAVNKLAGGARNSQHLRGEACDFEVPGLDNLELAHLIVGNPAIVFDQLILEFYRPGIPTSGWVHVSRTRAEKQRREVLTAKVGGGFAVGLPPLPARTG